MNQYIRRSIYILLYIGIIGLFIFIGTRDYNKKTYTNDQEKFSYEYHNIPQNNCFEYLNSTELIELLNSGSGLVFMGDADNIWSQAYAKYLYDAAKTYDIKKIYYYDARKVKELKNSNYYTIINELDGNLVTTDVTNDNLFTPSLYVIKKGKVLFYDVTSSVVKNDEKPSSFWTEEKIISFKDMVYNASQLIIDIK